MTADITSIPILSGARRVLGHLAELRDDRLGLLRRAAQEMDQIAVLRVLHRRVVLINGPAPIHEVLVEKAKSFDKPLSTRVSLMPLVGEVISRRGLPAGPRRAPALDAGGHAARARRAHRPPRGRGPA